MNAKSRSAQFRESLRMIDQFFEGRDPVHKTLRRLVNRLQKAEIPYAVVGGMALNAHHYRRTTADVDVLLTPEGFEAFQQRFVEKSYRRIPRRPRRFMDCKNKVVVDILVTGMYPGSGKLGPIAFPDPTQVSEVINDYRVIDLVNLVQLKLAARRWRDFADVVELIRFNDLDKAFADRLHPSIRGDYLECLEEKQREDEYETRDG